MKESDIYMPELNSKLLNVGVFGEVIILNGTDGTLVVSDFIYHHLLYHTHTNISCCLE